MLYEQFLFAFNLSLDEASSNTLASNQNYQFIETKTILITSKCLFIRFQRPYFISQAFYIKRVFLSFIFYYYLYFIYRSVQ